MRLTVPHADPGVPDARSAVRYLWWLVRRQRGRIALGAFFGSTWMVLLMAPPYLAARAIDTGLRERDAGALVGWTLTLVGVAVVTAAVSAMRHRTMTFVRLDAGYRTVEVVVRHAVRVGATLPRKVTAGEVVSIGAADLDRVMRTMTVTGPGVGGAVAYTVVTVLLVRISPLLAAVVLLGVPTLVLALGPLLNRLRDTETRYREHQGELTARAGDIVAGLRVLCGIGGKERFAVRYHAGSQALRSEGYRVGAVTSWISAIAVGLPSLFLAAITWLAARMAAAGELSIGEMVAVYGYVAVLVVPVAFFIEGAQDISRGVVAARRVVRILSLAPEISGGRAPAPTGPAELRDPDSGLVVTPGEYLAVAASLPGDAADLIDRIGGYRPSAATWGGIPLADISLDEVRARILVTDNDAYLFNGPLRDTLSAGVDHGDADLLTAVHAAMAEDVVTALPDGLDSSVEDQGRNVSGGQRQRLRLARAVLAAPEVLLLVEPTSAVDAHTEAVVAARLHEARRDRTTVVVGTSPLLLAQADRVAFLDDGTIAAVGSHEELLATEPRYRALVYRGSEEDLPEPAR
jgi:ABC-type multidrug transport system fused ATPase/permease subunit